MSHDYISVHVLLSWGYQKPLEILLCSSLVFCFSNVAVAITLISLSNFSFCGTYLCTTQFLLKIVDWKGTCMPWQGKEGRFKAGTFETEKQKKCCSWGNVFLLACCPEAAIPSWLKPQRRWKAESNKQSQIVVGNRASWKPTVCKAGVSGVRARQDRRLHCSVSGTWAGWHGS